MFSGPATFLCCESFFLCAALLWADHVSGLWNVYDAAERSGRPEEVKVRRGESGISDEVRGEYGRVTCVCVFNLYHSERECFGFNLAFSNVSPAESDVSSWYHWKESVSKVFFYFITAIKGNWISSLKKQNKNLQVRYLEDNKCKSILWIQLNAHYCYMYMLYISNRAWLFD